MRIQDRFRNMIYGARAGWSGYNAKALVPYSGASYGSLDARRMRYGIARAYYNNTIYDALDWFATRLKADQRLYRFIRAVENPVPLVVSLYIAYTYPGSIRLDNLKTGALPFIYDNDGYETALPQLIKWSNLNQQLSRIVRDATLLGDTAVWIADDPARQRIRIEPIDPEIIKFAERDEAKNVKAAVIEYEYEEEPEVARYVPSKYGMTLRDAKTHVYTMIADKERFRTFRDGEPFAFNTDADGNPVAEWENIYGFVPLKLAYYAEGEDDWGQNCFFGVPRRQIDELNDQASLINDSIRRAIAPLLAAKGITAADQISLKQEDKDSIAVLFLANPEAVIEQIKVELDYAGANGNKADIKKSLTENLPVLSLTQIRHLSSQMSGVAIEQLFGDATNVVKELRKNLDPCVSGSLQMATTMGAVRGYPGFERFNERSYDTGDMELSIAERPVIDDTLSKEQRLGMLPQLSSHPRATQRLMLGTAGYSDDEIDGYFAELDSEPSAPPQQQPVDGTSGTPERMARVADILQRAGVGETAGVQGATV